MTPGFVSRHLQAQTRFERALRCAALLLAVLATAPDVRTLHAQAATEASAASTDQVFLGRQLFFDLNLSRTRSQACASCHNPANGYSDPRRNSTRGAVSLGDDNVSLGNRNAPTLSYARFIPGFELEASGSYRGGLFLDGRARSLSEQAPGPLHDLREMALPDAATLVSRLRENPGYLEAFRARLGPAAEDDDALLYRAAISALVAFERSVEFSRFDSRYDRYLRGEYTMTYEESLGRELFFSDLSNCRHCHLRDEHGISEQETFTNYRYHNIGVPKNPLVNGTDYGLLGNPLVSDPSQAGKFRVPTLRNVAVTGPYMHNGVFGDLATAVLFYGKYLASNRRSNQNPERNAPWDPPEVGATIELELLQRGQPIDATRAGFLVAFLNTLTDRRYEHLISESAPGTQPASPAAHVPAPGQAASP